MECSLNDDNNLSNLDKSKDSSLADINFSNLEKSKDPSLTGKDSLMEKGQPVVSSTGHNDTLESSSLGPWMIVERKKRNGPNLLRGNPNLPPKGPGKPKHKDGPFQANRSNGRKPFNLSSEDFPGPSSAFHPGKSGGGEPPLKSTQVKRKPLTGLGKRARTHGTNEDSDRGDASSSPPVFTSQ